MDELIEALQIFRKYDNPSRPTQCEHDALHVCIDPEGISDEDKARLKELSFTPDQFGGFYSFRFGSA